MKDVKTNSDQGILPGNIMTTGMVGRVGVAIDSLENMEILFDGILMNSLKRLGML